MVEQSLEMLKRHNFASKQLFDGPYIEMEATHAGCLECATG